MAEDINIEEATSETLPEDTQYNFARVNAFRLTAIELPMVDFYCQLVQFPAATMVDAGSVYNPLNSIPMTGTRLDYGSLMVTFIVDERFANYKAVYNWLCGITFPQDHGQFTNLINSKAPYQGGFQTSSHETAIRSDIFLHVLDSFNNPVVRYHFHDAFPTSLEALPFDVTITDVNYFQAVSMFKFNYYTLEDVI